MNVIRHHGISRDINLRICTDPVWDCILHDVSNWGKLWICAFVGGKWREAFYLSKNRRRILLKKCDKVFSRTCIIMVIGPSIEIRVIGIAVKWFCFIHGRKIWIIDTRVYSLRSHHNLRLGDYENLRQWELKYKNSVRKRGMQVLWQLFTIISLSHRSYASSATSNRQIVVRTQWVQRQLL